MQETVEDGRGDDLVAPVCNVGDQDGGGLVVTPRDETEEERGLPSVQGQIAGLVDDQNLRIDPGPRGDSPGSPA